MYSFRYSIIQIIRQGFGTFLNGMSTYTGAEATFVLVVLIG